MSKNLEMGKSQGAWELASNSISPEPREHARAWRLFPEPRGLQPSPRAHAAPQAPNLIWSMVAGAGISSRERQEGDLEDGRSMTECHQVQGSAVQGGWGEIHVPWQCARPRVPLWIYWLGVGLRWLGGPESPHPLSGPPKSKFMFLMWTPFTCRVNKSSSDIMGALLVEVLWTSDFKGHKATSSSAFDLKPCRGHSLKVSHTQPHVSNVLILPMRLLCLSWTPLHPSYHQQRSVWNAHAITPVPCLASYRVLSKISTWCKALLSSDEPPRQPLTLQALCPPHSAHLQVPVT